MGFPVTLADGATRRVHKSATITLDGKETAHTDFDGTGVDVNLTANDVED